MERQPRQSMQRIGRNTLYNTTNQDYGSTWTHDGVRPQSFSLKKSVVPTYSEIVNTMSEFKKAQRLIKSKIINKKLQQEGIDPNSDNTKYMKKTQFHIKGEGEYKYPSHGLNVGPAIYRTNNMNYGSHTPAHFQIQSKYYPSNISFTKSFCGENFKFNGLNTVKTVSKVHDGLNDL